MHHFMESQLLEIERDSRIDIVDNVAYLNCRHVVGLVVVRSSRYWLVRIYRISSNRFRQSVASACVRRSERTHDMRNAIILTLLRRIAPTPLGPFASFAEDARSLADSN